MKLSTRNRLPGAIVEVEKGDVMAKVTLRVGDDHLVSLITRESAEEMGLEESKQVVALIKATDVMLMVRDETA
jgi:molybdopterin-binding protein